MPAFSRVLAAGLCLAAAASAADAQVRRVSPAPSGSSSPSSFSTRAAQAAPQPGGLNPVFPAGINSGSGAAVSNDPIAASTSPVPPAGTSTAGGTGTTTTGGAGGMRPELGFDQAAAAAATTVLGAGPGVRGPGQRAEGGAGGFSATDIARSFFFADGNKDGDLTRAEAARLSISTMSFEEMDRNYDGLISRFEYDDSLR